MGERERGWGIQVRGRKGGDNETTSVVVTGRMSKVLTGGIVLNHKH